MSKRCYQPSIRHLRLTARPLILCAGACFCADSGAQTACPPGPVVMTTGECRTNGQPITVATTNGSALNASLAGVITADGSAISLNAGGTTAARASTGGTVYVQGGHITNGFEANLLQGFAATGPGSHIEVAGSSLTFTATARRDNWHGATASNQAGIGLLNTSITLNVGGQGNGTWGLTAETGGAITSDGVDVRLVSDSATNSSSNARGVLARTGGSVALQDSSVLVDYAVGTVGVGLRAEGPNSAISFQNGTVTTSARSVRATGAWTSGGASIRLSNSQLLANATASTATLTSAALGARVDTGGSLLLDQGTSLLSTGRYNYGIYATDAGSTARLDNASIDVSGDLSRAGIWAVAGAQVEVVNASQIVNRSPYTVATYGIYADNLAGAATPTTLHIQDSTIATHANVAGAAIALRYGAVAELSNVLLETAGSGESIGIWSDNATLTATNITVRTLGERARGITSDRSTGSTILNGGSIITRGGTEAHALATRLGGNLTGTNLAIQTFGGGQSSGAAADNSLLTLNNSTVDVAGPGSYGIWALSEPVSSPEGPALISLDQVQVRTLGDGAFGVVAQRWHQPSPAAVQANALSVDTRGSEAHGLLATSGGEIESRNSRVATTGSAAFGALAYQHDSRVHLIGTPVGVTGAGAHAAVAYAGGSITGDQAQLSAYGQGAAALLVIGELDPSTGLVTSAGAALNSSTLTSMTGPVIGMAGPSSVVLEGSSAGAADTAAVLPWLAVAATSDFPLPVLASPTLPLPITPDPPDPPDDPSAPFAPAVAGQPRAAALPPVAIAAQPGMADILVQDSVVTGTATTAPGSVSQLTLSDSVWNLTGNSNVTHLVNDPSLIDFSAPVGGAFKTLTVQTYSGDGTLALNTFLGDDASSSDRLVIDAGNATAASLLQIKPAGGAGALTLGNGILVIDTVNAGTTTPGSFSLAGPVVAGPYEYFLYRSSVDVSGPENWYLRSVVDCSIPGGPSPPCPAPPPPPPPVPPDPPTPPTPPAPPVPPVPAFRQEVSLAAALPTMAAYYGRALVDTLHERVGDESLLRGRSDLSPERRGMNGAWVRALAHDGKRDGGSQGIYGAAGPSFEYRFQALQVGLDLYRAVDDDHSHRHAGMYFAYGKGEGDVRHNLPGYDFHAGSDELVARTVGAYWTAFNTRGAYLDAVGQYTSYDLRARSTRLPDAFTNGTGMLVSLEGGMPFAPERDRTAADLTGWRLEPQAQLIWQRVEIDDLIEPSATVRYRDGDAMVGRAGLRVNHLGESDSPEADIRRRNAWLRLNLWHQFDGAPRTEFSSQAGYVPFMSELEDTWAEVGLGGTWQVSETGYLFADVDYTWSFDGDQTAWNGKLGMRWNW